MEASSAASCIAGALLGVAGTLFKTDAAWSLMVEMK
jgi:hypothetical protein